MSSSPSLVSCPLIISKSLRPTNCVCLPVPVKDVEDAVSADTPEPEVVESVVLVEEETSAIDEPEPEVDSKPPIVETAEVDADPRDLEPVVSQEIDPCLLTLIHSHSRTTSARTNQLPWKVRNSL